MADNLKYFAITGFLYYKKVILELTLLLVITWAGVYCSSTITMDGWKKMDVFEHKRYYVGYVLLIATTLKSFFSKSVEDAKQAQKEGDTEIFRRKGV